MNQDKKDHDLEVEGEIDKKHGTLPIEPSGIHLSGKELLIIIFAKIFSFVLTIVILLTIVVGIGSAAGYIYDATHHFPDPVSRGDDLGGGFVVFFSLAIGCIASLILFYPLNRLVYSVTKKIWGSK